MEEMDPEKEEVQDGSGSKQGKKEGKSDEKQNKSPEKAEGEGQEEPVLVEEMSIYDLIRDQFQKAVKYEQITDSEIHEKSPDKIKSPLKSNDKQANLRARLEVDLRAILENAWNGNEDFLSVRRS